MLRKILRRAIRHGRLLGQEKPFLFEMVFAVRDLMQGAYPELVDSAERVAKVVEAEEKQFDRVLKDGHASDAMNLDSKTEPGLSTCRQSQDLRQSRSRRAKDRRPRIARQSADIESD